MALPYADQSFDAAVMALVIFFVPEPERGVAEMVRVCKPGASISTYAWDIPGGGFPYAITQEEMEAFGSPSVWPPSKDAAKMENLQALWSKAGIIDLDTKVIEVKRRFENFDTFWSTMLSGPSAMKRLESLSAADRATFQQRVRARVTTSDHDGVVLSARANAIKGRLPG
jgi:SAM-dependent methyltransferase